MNRQRFCTSNSERGSIWRTVRGIVLAALFLAGFCAIYSRVDFVLRRKPNAPHAQEMFAKYPRNRAKIVFVGSSHQFCSIDPDLLSEEYGMESFMLATSAQTTALSYYAVLEAIERQHPETIVLELYYTTYDKLLVTEDYTHEFTDALPSLRVKWSLIEELIPEGERIYYHLPIGVSHSRWKTLIQSDYEMEDMTARGGYTGDFAGTAHEISLIPREESEPVPAQNEEYLDRIVEACSESGTNLIFYVAPYGYPEPESAEDAENLEELGWDLAREQRMYHYLEAYAERAGVEFHNLFYELDAIGLERETDWQDGQHLNAAGRAKLTKFMADNGYLW